MGLVSHAPGIGVPANIQYCGEWALKGVRLCGVPDLVEKATLFLHTARNLAPNAVKADVDGLTMHSNDMIDALRAFISCEDSGMSTDGKPCYALVLCTSGLVHKHADSAHLHADSAHLDHRYKPDGSLSEGCL